MKKVVKIMSVVLAILMIAGCFAACGNTEKVTAKVIDIELTEEKYAFGVDGALAKVIVSVVVVVLNYVFSKLIVFKNKKIK